MVEATPMQLHNTYWLLRHGRSTANEADLIVAELVRAAGAPHA